MSLATFSLRKCCIRQATNRAITEQQQRQQQQHRPFSGGVVLRCTASIFYYSDIFIFLLLSGEKRGSISFLLKRDKHKRICGSNPDNTISIIGTWLSKLVRQEDRQEDRQEGDMLCSFWQQRGVLFCLHCAHKINYLHLDISDQTTLDLCKTFFCKD